jgi:hypothetical protein
MATSKHLLLLLLGLIFLTVDVLGARVAYTAWYREGLGGKPGSTRRYGQLKDVDVEPLLAHIEEWSGRKFQAERGEHNIIIVRPFHRTRTKTQASGVVQEEIQLVCRKLKECGPTTEG